MLNRRIGIIFMILVILGVFAFSAWANFNDPDQRVEFTKR